MKPPFVSEFAFAGALFFFVGLGPASHAQDCTSNPPGADIRQCLNELARTLLQPGSPADRRFQERFARLLARYDLRMEQVKSRPLDESFKILIEDGCFDFAALNTVDKSRLVGHLQAQILEASLFLADVHANAFGRQVSVLFPIREISLCARSKTNPRPLVFAQRSLRLNLGPRPLSAEEVLGLWNSGNPIRSTEISGAEKLPWLGDYVRRWKQKSRSDQEGLVRDRLAENWIVLNPVGELRVTAVFTLAEAVFKLGREAFAADSPGGESSPSAGHMRTRLMDTLRGPGFTADQRARVAGFGDNDIRGLFRLWREKLFSTENILGVFENAIGEQARHDNLHLTLRKLNGGVVVVNDHNIVVRLEQLMDASIPVSRFADDAKPGSSVEITRRSAIGESITFKVDHVNPRDLTLNADQVNGGVVVDTIDNVIVTVQLPKISPSAYRRVSLHQALEQYIEGMTVPAAPPR